MKKNEVERIEEYLGGEMGPDERKSFERELESDKELFAVYNTYRTIERYMFNQKKCADEDALKNTLTKLGAEFFGTASETNRSVSEKKEPPSAFNTIEPGTPSKISHHTRIIQTWKLAAAVFLGIIAIGTWYLLTDKKNIKKQIATTSYVSSDSAGRRKTNIDTVLQVPVLPNPSKHDIGKDRKPEQSIITEQKLLFAKYFTPDSAPEDKEGPLEDAFNQYERRQYKRAAAAFENAEPDLSLRGQETDIPLARFYASYYKALSYMAIDKDVKAIQQLKNLTSTNSFLQAKVTWYLALSYLRTGNIQEALSLLGKVSENEQAGDYRSRANELIIELKKA